MRFTFRPITKHDVRAITTWRYDPPYDFYNWDPADDPAELLDPAMGYVAAIDEAGDLVGFCCFGPGGQVPGARRAGLYADDALDVGLGLRPDMTGRGLGLGLAFVEAGLAYAVERFMPNAFRMSVGTFNERAIRVYQRAGFDAVGRCLSLVGGVETEFLVMRLAVSPRASC